MVRCEEANPTGAFAACTSEASGELRSRAMGSIFGLCDGLGAGKCPCNQTTPELLLPGAGLRGTDGATAPPMTCPRCGEANAGDRVECARCGEVLLDGQTATRVGPLADPSAPTAKPAATVVGPVSSSDATFSVYGLSATQPGTGPPLLTGVFAGRYEILALIGEGGMGRVYKARDQELDKVIALKTIRGRGGDPDSILRFKQELVLARKVTHKNVVRIFDLGEADGQKFFTMEFIEGDSLKALVRRRGRLPPDEGSRWRARCSPPCRRPTSRGWSTAT